MTERFKFKGTLPVMKLAEFYAGQKVETFGGDKAEIIELIPNWKDKRNIDWARAFILFEDGNKEYYWCSEINPLPDPKPYLEMFL